MLNYYNKIIAPFFKYWGYQPGLTQFIFCSIKPLTNIMVHWIGKFMQQTH